MKNSRQNWLNSLKNGDSVWRYQVFPIEYATDIASFFKEGEFGGWLSFQDSKGGAWLKCPYDGGFSVSPSTIFKTKKEAEKHAAKEVLKEINNCRRDLEKEIKKLDKESQKWQILANE